MVIKFDDIVADEQVPRQGYGIADVYAYEAMVGLGMRYKRFMMMALEPKSATGYHVHEDDMEVMIMLDGTANYNDNGTQVVVSTGDMLICNKGEGHSIEVVGDEPITYLAIIAEVVE